MKNKTVFFLGLAVFLLIPFPITVARKCTITVLDENGKPWVNAKISRGWAYGSQETLEDGITGADGTVKFAPRVQAHSFLARGFISILDVLVVHGNAHVDDEYIVTYPTNYTAEIESDAWFRWVYDEGHIAKVDLQNLPRGQTCQAKFILKKKAP